jgi:hypothetical protein
MIEGISGRDGMTPAARAAPRPAATAFHVDDDGGAGPGRATASAAAAAAAAEAGAPGALHGMLVLQEELEESAPDRRARRRGQDLLGALAALQRDLLLGSIGPGCLRDLADLLIDMPVADSAALGESVAAVALRARLELWRHGEAAIGNDSQPSRRRLPGT